MSTTNPILDDLILSFRKHKQWAEKAFSQVQTDQAFFHQPGEFSNSIAAIIKHVAGNLRSRWTDFLTTDGEKPDRDRDSEFIIGEQDSRELLLQSWEAGWSALLHTLARLTEDDLAKVVTIRGEAHTVLQATVRSLTHVAYHTGQIVYLARLVQKDNWEWITIPPGQSRQFNETTRLQPDKQYLR